MINLVSVSFAILAFILFVSYKTLKHKEVVLNDAVMVIIAAGMLPIAITFVVYPFYPSLIKSIDTMSLQITLTGLVLLFVYTKTIIDKIKSDGS